MTTPPSNEPTQSPNREVEEIETCAICGEPDPDKIPHPERWPGEFVPPSGELVHDECEREECERAHGEFTNRVGADGVREFLRGISNG